MLDAIDSPFSASSEDWSDIIGEIFDRSSSSMSGDGSFSASPETKKDGLLRCFGARLLRKHKKKRTTSDELNSSQQSADISITTDNYSTIIFESNSNNRTSSEGPQVVTGFTAPLSSATSSLFRDELNSKAPYSSVNTSILQVPEMRGESAGASSTILSTCRLDNSTSTADNVENRFRSAILSQMSPSKNDGIEAARMRLKASLATMSIPKKTVACSENSSGSPTDTFPLFGSEVINGIPHNTSTLQTAPVNEITSNKLMKKSSVTNWRKKKEVYTPPKSRFPKYFTTTKKGYNMTTQRLEDGFQRKDQNVPTQDTISASAMLTPTPTTLMAETCSSSSKNPTNVLPLKVETGNVKDLTKAVPQKNKVGFGPKMFSLLALMKLSEERSTQRKIESYWNVREDFRNSMTFRKGKHRKHRKDSYPVTDSTPSESSSFRFNPTESDDINGAKEPLSSPGVSNAEYDTNAFGFDVKIEQVAVPFESQADQIIPNSPKESTVIHEAYCSDSSYNNATSFQISLAKEDEIEAARIRMEAYMAKRKSQMTTTIKVTSPNNMNQISQSQSDEVSGDKQLAKSGDKAPAELTEASKNNSVLDPTALSTPSVETKFAADSSNCSSKKGLRSQISPPENDEIEAARIRMEAYLAKKIGSKKN
ncbi:unnamed protein product [Caenorhabditis brenneri]